MQSATCVLPSTWRAYTVGACVTRVRSVIISSSSSEERGGEVNPSNKINFVSWIIDEKIIDRNYIILVIYLSHNL